jgi:diguanylate cyclase (GGDEF)-like protein/PAS domain S-box-containing protein
MAGLPVQIGSPRRRRAAEKPRSRQKVWRNDARVTQAIALVQPDQSAIQSAAERADDTTMDPAGNPESRVRMHAGFLLPYVPIPLGLVVFWWLESAGLIQGPYWLIVACLGVSCLLSASSLILTRGSSRRARIRWRSASSAVATTLVLYQTGWGPILAVGYALGVADIVTAEDGKGWRTAAGWMAAGIGTGQILIELGLAPSVTSPALSHAIAAANLLCSLILLRLFAASTTAAADARAALGASESRFRSLVQNSTDVIAVIDGRGVVEYVSPAIERVIGVRPADCVGQDVGTVLGDPERRERLVDFAFVGDFALGETHQVETELRHVDGELRVVEVSLTRLDNDVIVANIHDLTARRRLEDALRRQAHTDVLTGIPNRAAITEILDDAVRGAPVAVMYIDLDGFKTINDRLGHERGDRVLVEAARRISASIGALGAVGRLGGDEFLAVLPRVGDADVVHAADRILNALRAPWPQADGISASIGVAFSRPDEPGDHLMRRADLAMYEAKENGRARCRLAA